MYTAFLQGSMRHFVAEYTQVAWCKIRHLTPSARKSECSKLTTSAKKALSVCGYSCRRTLNNELCTFSSPLYSMKPSLLNLFMKKLTRGRVVPIISASIS